VLEIHIFFTFLNSYACFDMTLTLQRSDKLKVVIHVNIMSLSH